MVLSRRAVLTGLGLVTPIGLGVGAFGEALRAGRGGIHRIRSFDPSALPTQFGGEIEGFDARDYLDKKDRKRLNTMARTVQFAVAAARLAMDDARLLGEQIEPTRFGVVFGAGTIPGEPGDLGPAALLSTDGQPGSVDLLRWGEAGIPNIPPMWMLNHVPNMLACHVSILHNAQGPNNTITQTDAADLLALGEAYRLVCRGRADLFLAGGADARINPITLIRQCLFSPLSKRNEASERACRPFDRGRDGIVLGEGAGVLVLEELEHAQRRGVKIRGEVVGLGSAFDRERSGEGLARAIRSALSEAAIGPKDLDHVNAHGLSSVDGDIWEARGLHEGLGGCPVPVFAAKSYFGNLGAGSATTELAASLLALEDGLLPATLNYEEPDPGCPVAVVAVPRPVTRAHFLKVSLTPLGQCAAVVIRSGNDQR
ncbi:MAG: beta-ketoacyl-[acyl-carrier-protein] synthase family protein [Gemmataceae bacterium]|nr:beta-ketoacyl-[acyl-carrier-protein] synthase family protein [Gemmataceae bacterium]